MGRRIWADSLKKFGLLYLDHIQIPGFCLKKNSRFQIGWGLSTLTSQVVTAWGLSMLLGLSSAIAFTGILSTPQAAQAYTARVTLFLRRNPAESYETFLRRAEAIARAGIQRSFDADLLTTEAIVVIVGENQGVSMPIMEVQVTRNEWRDRPDPEYWVQYYESAPTLLNF